MWMGQNKKDELKNRTINKIAMDIYVGSCGRKSLGETPQCECTRRLTSSPRKAEYISRAGMRSYNIRVLFNSKPFCPSLIFNLLVVSLTYNFHYACSCVSYKSA